MQPIEAKEFINLSVEKAKDKMDSEELEQFRFEVIAGGFKLLPQEGGYGDIFDDVEAHMEFSRRIYEKIVDLSEIDRDQNSWFGNNENVHMARL